MTQIRWYTDEDVFRAIALELRRHGYDAVSAGNLGWEDPDHLAFANQSSRVLVEQRRHDVGGAALHLLQQHHRGVGALGVVEQRRHDVGGPRSFTPAA
jgi:hypothetical protein